MKDQSTIEKEPDFERWDRGRTLFLESVHKPDHQLRSCAHNQKCYDELMEIREDVIKMVQKMPNPYKPKLKPGEKNNETVKSINGISVVLLRGALGESYMKDWSEEHKKEWEEYVSINS